VLFKNPLSPLNNSGGYGMNSHTTRAYDHLKNQTVSWLPMDTKELFLEHQSNDDTRKEDLTPCKVFA
jgi:hypothetical protein